MSLRNNICILRTLSFIKLCINTRYLTINRSCHCIHAALQSIFCIRFYFGHETNTLSKIYPHTTFQSHRNADNAPFFIPIVQWNKIELRNRLWTGYGQAINTDEFNDNDKKLKYEAIVYQPENACKIDLCNETLFALHSYVNSANSAICWKAYEFVSHIVNGTVWNDSWMTHFFKRIFVTYTFDAL